MFVGEVCVCGRVLVCRCVRDCVNIRLNGMFLNLERLLKIEFSTCV